MFNINELISNRVKNKGYLNDFTKEKRELTEKYKISDDKEDNEKDSKYTKIEEFYKCCSGYLMVEENVDLDYKSEIKCCNGIKTLINILSLSFINKDEYIITASSEENSIFNMCEWLGGKIYKCKCKLE